MFDGEYNITAIIDWSNSQTTPLESFAVNCFRIIAKDNGACRGVKDGYLAKERRQLKDGRRHFVVRFGGRIVGFS